ncbi:hypothetical protein B0O80DRAFT_500062 [Mortierella sp. GBAus27b]|nr:hypothetical protein B0O80DRAFT_500062 [Mortierella sp. GBAus27b]
MPPLTAIISSAAHMPDCIPSQQHEPHIGDPKTAPVVVDPWSIGIGSKPASPPSHRLDVKTHVFKKELQEYIPTQGDDRHRIETIIYIDLSVVKQDDGSLAKMYDYVCLPKEVLFTLPDKVMPPEVMASKRILDINVILKSPSNDWRIEKEACARCVRRMSAKLEQDEVRIMHILPELYRTENGDALIHFRNGIANIQLKVNCYCGHKMEKEGFVVCFGPQSDTSIAAHGTTPLMFYHQNKNRIAARAIAAAAKAEAKAEKLRQQQEARAKARSSTKGTPRSHGQQRQETATPAHYHIPSPPDSSFNSPVDLFSSPELGEGPDVSFMAPSPTQTDPMSSLFPEFPSPPCPTASLEQQQTQEHSMAMISHTTPDNGPTRGGTLVTIHGSGFSVGEMMYICFGETSVPVIPRHDQMVECYTPARAKAETVTVFALHSTAPTNIPSQCTFTYVDDNEKELVKLALQRIMSLSARMDGPLDSVMQRASELLLWSDILGVPGNLDSSSTSHSQFSSAETMVMESLKLLDTPNAKNNEGISISNNTSHTMLHLSVLSKYKALAQELILRGIDVNAKDKNGHTAEDLARILGDKTMIDIFDSIGSKTIVADQLDRDIPGPHDVPGSQKTPGRLETIDPHDSPGPYGILGPHDTPGSPDKAGSRIAGLRTLRHDDLQMDYELEGHGPNPNDGHSNSMELEEQGRVHEQREHREVERSTVRSINAPHDMTGRISGQNHDRLLVQELQGVSARLTALAEGGQVVVVRRCNNNGEQATVQSSRHDVESEPVFLGGLPVLSPLSRTTATRICEEEEEDTNSSAPSNGNEEPAESHA